MKKLLVLLVLLSCTKEDEPMRMFITTVNTPTITTSKTIYEIGGVAGDDTVNNATFINEATSEGYEVTFPLAETFYVSSPIIYDGSIKLTGVVGSEIKLAPNSNDYMLRPSSTNTEAYEILHETVDITGLTFNGNRYNGNDVRNFTGSWLTGYYGFGIVLSNTRYITLTNTTHQDGEAWNVACFGNYSLTTSGVTLKYSGESPSNGDGISGPNVYTSHTNLTSIGLTDDTTGIGNGNGSIQAALVGMNYYIDVEEYTNIGMDISGNSRSPIGFYPNTKEFKNIYIEDYEYDNITYAAFFGSYWSSRPVTRVESITIKNSIIHINDWTSWVNIHKAFRFELLECDNVTIENITFIDDRLDDGNRPDLILIRDDMENTTFTINNVSGNFLGNVTLYNGIKANGHAYITNNNITATGYTVTESIGSRPVN